jgi:ribose transport system ATP-binding protein
MVQLASETDSRPLVRTEGIKKHYGGVQALKGVGANLWRGEVHGLVGANGAGKSTFIKILAGLEIPDAGLIEVNGSEVKITGPDHASVLGFSFIHQELNLVPQMTALQNIMLGLPKPTRLGLVDWRRIRRTVEPFAERVSIKFPLDTRATALSVAERWLVSICRSLVRSSRLIVMDEPTASLSAHECDRLFQIIKDLSHHEVAVLYVSHRLGEIVDLCHRVTAFRDGAFVAQFDRTSVSQSKLVDAIVGIGETQALASSSGSADLVGAEIALSVRGLRRARFVRGIDFDLRRGEVLGLSGLVGSGRSEVVRLIFGADGVQGGQMSLYGHPYAPQNPSEAIRAGVGLVPEERRSEGLVVSKSVAFNLNLASLRAPSLGPGLALLNMRKRAQRSREMANRLRIKTPRIETVVGRLSGGNQQKVVIGKWLGLSLRVLMLDEPSRGVDIGARREIHGIVRELAAAGVAIIVISSEAEELPGLCDRVLVMMEGRVVRELSGTEITREALVQASYADPMEEVH